MNKDVKTAVQSGSKAAPETFYIRVTAAGPYLVYGNPPIDQEIIVPNEEGASWEYRKGMKFDNSDNPVALCRCGNSKEKPYCDGNHTRTHWNPVETNAGRSLLDDAKTYTGPLLILADNEEYCVHARFCTARASVWRLVKTALTDEEIELARHETENCPAGRLILLNRETNEIYEPAFDPSIGIIQDPIMKVSGPLWVKGGISILNADGESYEIRNRVTLCRCGMSANKPFCDGSHEMAEFTDGLPMGDETE